MSVYKTILHNAAKGKKMLAVLLDPDKCFGEAREAALKQLAAVAPDFIFIGGSQTHRSADELIRSLQSVPVPKVLFPGDAAQFTPQADALLFLSLISGRNADYLIGQHVKSARGIKKSGIEVIPTAYLLIDGGKETAVKRVSHTQPIAADDVEMCVHTAVAGELLGLKMTYLEAGSGAHKPVSASIITAVRNEISHPLIVGGGIKTLVELKNAFTAGADLVVVGNHFEAHPEEIPMFVEWVRGIVKS